MSFAALGRPYPVTQDPFTYHGGRVVEANDSLYGRRCGERCSCFSGSSFDGVPNHDCHFASVKLQTVKGNPGASKSFYPCPLRQEPEYDEIVLFKSERVCPVAHVSFTRRCVRLFACSCLFVRAVCLWRLFSAICCAWWSHRWLSRSRMLLWLHEAKDSVSELKSFSIAGFSEKNFDDLQAKMGDGHGEVTAMHAAITISSASLAVSLAPPLQPPLPLHNSSSFRPPTLRAKQRSQRSCMVSRPWKQSPHFSQLIPNSSAIRPRFSASYPAAAYTKAQPVSGSFSTQILCGLQPTPAFWCSNETLCLSPMLPP
jgi:hypothetical protein